MKSAINIYSLFFLINDNYVCFWIYLLNISVAAILAATQSKAAAVAATLAASRSRAAAVAATLAASQSRAAAAAATLAASRSGASATRFFY